MGQSTDAIICYGIKLGEEDEIPKWVWDFAGLEDKRDTGDDDGEVLYSLYMALESKGLTLVTHCSDVCTMYVLAAKGSQITAWRGETKKMDLTKLLGKEKTYQKAFSKLGRATKPSWILCSWWG